MQSNAFKNIALDLLEEARREADEANKSKSDFMFVGLALASWLRPD